MAFTPKAQPGSASIREVTLGVGKNAVTLGGQNVLPFYTFDGNMPHAPAIGAEVCDLEGDLAANAAKAAAMPEVDFVCLHLASADPNGADRSVEECVRAVTAAVAAVDKPVAIMGCQNLEKDTALFEALASVGQRMLFLSARNENYPAVAKAVKDSHVLCAETADDTNLAKQLNILLRGVDVPEDGTVMNIGTAAVGYGYEYVASTMDRIRLAALYDGDTDLLNPIIAPVSTDTWSVKESTATEEDEPLWGSREERIIAMEIATAAADLTSGADAVILRHRAAIQAVKQFITALM